MNAIAEAAVNSHAGTLLGDPVTVRFTPRTYTWRWGDGATDAVSTPGTTWAALRTPRLTPTPTSHVYSERGEVTLALDVAYTVEYRLAEGAWTPVAGTVSASASTPIRVATASTVIVPGDCRSDPAGVGC